MRPGGIQQVHSKQPVGRFLHSWTSAEREYLNLTATLGMCSQTGGFMSLLTQGQTGANINRNKELEAKSRKEVKRRSGLVK